MNSLKPGLTLTVLALALLCSLAISRAADAWKLPQEKPQLAPGPGRELVLGQCILCHSTDYISTQPPLTRPQWQATVDKMRVRYGAPVTTNQTPAIIDYLTATYGRGTTP